MHQPASGYYEAQTGEFVLEAEELLKLRALVAKMDAQLAEKDQIIDKQTEQLYPKIWKEMFLCQQQKPKLMELLIL